MRVEDKINLINIYFLQLQLQVGRQRVSMVSLFFYLNDRLKLSLKKVSMKRRAKLAIKNDKYNEINIVLCMLYTLYNIIFRSTTHI